MVDLAWSSPAALAIAPVQDILNLGPEARMKVPGRTPGNWGLRYRQYIPLEPAFERLRDLTENSKRSSHEVSGQLQRDRCCGNNGMIHGAEHSGLTYFVNPLHALSRLL